MLFVTKSAAIAFVKPITAAFVAPYTQRLGAPIYENHKVNSCMQEQKYI
jgi:hypothetical protein